MFNVISTVKTKFWDLICQIITRFNAGIATETIFYTYINYI